MKFYLFRYHHPEENKTRLAILEIGKFTLIEMIIDKNIKGFELEIKS